jgi:hypothetical protein
MGRRKYRDARRHFRYVGGAVVDRVLDEGTQSTLRMLPGQPVVTSTWFAASVNWEDRTQEMDAFVERTFDAWLYFDNSGPREVGFRIPQRVLPAQAVARHVVGDILSGLAAETTEDDLLLRFRYYAKDSEGFNLGETGEGWLHRILPVREELLSGNTARSCAPPPAEAIDHLPPCRVRLHARTSSPARRSRSSWRTRPGGRTRCAMQARILS